MMLNRWIWSFKGIPVVGQLRSFMPSVRILFKWSGPVSVCSDSKIYNVATEARMCATEWAWGRNERDEIAGKKSGYKCLGGAIWLWAKLTRNGFGAAKWNRWNGGGEGGMKGSRGKGRNGMWNKGSQIVLFLCKLVHFVRVCVCPLQLQLEQTAASRTTTCLDLLICMFYVHFMRFELGLSRSCGLGVRIKYSTGHDHMCVRSNVWVCFCVCVWGGGHGINFSCDHNL